MFRGDQTVLARVQPETAGLVAGGAGVSLTDCLERLVAR